MSNDFYPLGDLLITPRNCLPDVMDKYVYPVVPGTEEWNAASEEEKEMLCQLPEDRIKTLSTYALIRSLMDKPLLWNYYLSSNASPVVSCDRFIFSRHNSVPEFEKRNNRVQALLSYYAAVCFDCYESLDTGERINFNIQLCVLEVWFVRDAILHSMNTVQKKQAVSLLLQKYEQSPLYSDASLVAMIWIMYDDLYPPIMALPKDVPFNAGQRNDIISFAKSYTH
jgi:hypothetical protein